MRSNNYKSVLKHAGLAATVLLLASGVAFGQQTVNLSVGPATAIQPDGTAVPMWGYTCGTAVTGSTPPSGTIANSPTGEAGFAFMWHSHNEREITTNNIFPGGLMTMMLVDPWVFLIDESK